jgi:hypothetical protein
VQQDTPAEIARTGYTWLFLITNPNTKTLNKDGKRLVGLWSNTNQTAEGGRIRTYNYWPHSPPDEGEGSSDLGSKEDPEAPAGSKSRTGTKVVHPTSKDDRNAKSPGSSTNSANSVSPKMTLKSPNIT